MIICFYLILTKRGKCFKKNVYDVIIQNDTQAEELRKLINTGSVFRILTSFNDPRFEVTIREALEEHALLQQNAKLLQLVNEQNERLKRLTTELEERVEVPVDVGRKIRAEPVELHPGTLPRRYISRARCRRC